MATPLKYIYNDTFFEKLHHALKQVYPNFNATAFQADVYRGDWDYLVLKQRMRHITECLNMHLTSNFSQDINILIQAIPHLVEQGLEVDNLECIFLPDFIEIYGINDYDVAIPAIETMTQYVTCEFTVRPFLIQYPEKMLSQMIAWSKHEHASVRRLATEGCRPRLPWAMALTAYKKDPRPILPILETLKNDSSDYVHRSVANNLNDIAKDHPEMVIDTVKRWIGQTKITDWVCKHASRTLLKQGNQEIMALFGFGSTENIRIETFAVQTPIVTIGAHLDFSFTLKNLNRQTAKIRLEYGIYYQKANGSLSKKVFKISEKAYEAQSLTKIQKRQSFKIISTRKFHVGHHQVSIIINGVEFEKLDFELTHP